MFLIIYFILCYEGYAMKPLSLSLAVLFALIVTLGQSALAVDAVTPVKDRTIADAESGIPLVVTRPPDASQANVGLTAAEHAKRVAARDYEDAVAATVNVADTPDAVGTPDTDASATAVANTPLSQVVAVLFALAVLAGIVYWASRVAQYRRDHPETIRPANKKDTTIFS